MKRSIITLLVASCLISEAMCDVRADCTRTLRNHFFSQTQHIPIFFTFFLLADEFLA